MILYHEVCSICNELKTDCERIVSRVGKNHEESYKCGRCLQLEKKQDIKSCEECHSKYNKEDLKYCKLCEMYVCENCWGDADLSNVTKLGDDFFGHRHCVCCFECGVDTWEDSNKTSIYKYGNRIVYCHKCAKRLIEDGIRKSTDWIESCSFRRAVEKCDEILELCPENALALALRCQAYYHVNEYKKSLNDLLKSTKYDPAVFERFPKMREIRDFFIAKWK